MKKILLSFSMLLGMCFTVEAQYSTGFETAEGFTLGTVQGQNGWTVSQDAEENPVAGFDVVTQGGSNALKVSSNANFDPSNDGVFLGAFSPALTTFGVTTASFDVMLEEDADEETFTSNYALILQSNADELLTAWVEFNFEGEILINEGEGGTDSGATWTAGEWMQIDITIDSAAGTIVYKLNGETIHEGEVWAADNFDQALIFHDNWNGSNFYVDSVDVVEGSTAGNEEFSASQVSVYPNPANNVITIANSGEGAVLNNVILTDINGRTVKKLQLNNDIETQMNISDLSSGIYMATISSDKGTITKKIIKN